MEKLVGRAARTNVFRSHVSSEILSSSCKELRKFSRKFLRSFCTPIACDDSKPVTFFKAGKKTYLV